MLSRATALLLVIVAVATGFGLGVWLSGDNWVEPIYLDPSDEAGA